MRKVKAIVEHLGANTVPLPHALRELDEVRGATERLAREIR